MIPEEHDMTKPQLPEDLPNELISRKRKPTWAREVIEEAKRHGAPEGAIRERKKPKSYPSYMALMCDLVDKEPTCFEEAIKQKEWADAMVKEYQSIMKNDVWEVVPRPKHKSVVSSKWIFKTKHSTDGSTEKYKARFVARGFSQKEKIDYEETFVLVVR